VNAQHWSYLDTYEFALPTFSNNMSGAQAASAALAIVFNGPFFLPGSDALVDGVAGLGINNPQDVLIPYGLFVEPRAAGALLLSTHFTVSL
jgi:hypothetical protein